MYPIKKTAFEITGRHVLFAVVLFFGCITFVNAIMISHAVRSFPGEQQKKSYMQGLKYNDVLEARAEQKKLGWIVTMPEVLDVEEGGVVVSLKITDALGLPVSGAIPSLFLGRPATDHEDRFLSLLEVSPGTYAVQNTPISTGAWNARVMIEQDGVKKFVAEKRLWLK